MLSAAQRFKNRRTASGVMLKAKFLDGQGADEEEDNFRQVPEAQMPIFPNLRALEDGDARRLSQRGLSESDEVSNHETTPNSRDLQTFAPVTTRNAASPSILNQPGAHNFRHIMHPELLFGSSSSTGQNM